MSARSSVGETMGFEQSGTRGRSDLLDEGPTASLQRAQAERRAGRPDRAERLAGAALAAQPDRADARAVLALALLDQGRLDAARNELERLADGMLASVAHGAEDPDFSEGEIDRAFEDARPDPEQVIDADRIAREALEQTELPEALLPTRESAFATATMAELLARQGDTDGASRIRAALEAGGPLAREADESAAHDAFGEGASDPFERGEGLFPLDGASRRRETVATLERWLANVRRR